MSFLSADDEIDFDAAASQFPDISLDGSTDISALPTATATTTAPKSSQSLNNDFFLDDFERPSTQTNVKVTGDDEIEKFESEFPELDVAPVAPVAAPSFLQQQPQPTGFGATIAPRPHTFASTPILNQPLEEEEPDVIKEWRAKQAQEIEAREQAAKERKQKTISDAEKAIDDFYEEYAKKKERNILQNKEEEQAYIQSMTDKLSAGTTWERICELIDLQNSQSKTVARTGPGTTDLSRYKEVLLRLKREGASAPGAGGY